MKKLIFFKAFAFSNCFMNDYASMSKEELIGRLQSADHVISEQRRLLQAKEMMLQNYITQFTQLTSDYEQLIETHYTRSEYPSHYFRDRAPPPICPEQRSVANKFDDDYPAPPVREQYISTPVSPTDLPEPMYIQQPVIQQPNQTRRAMMSSIAFGADEDPEPVKVMSSVRQSQNICRTAMADHFSQHFDDAPAQVAENERCPMNSKQLPPLAVDTRGMTVDEMRAKVDELNAIRAEMDRKLSKALPKGKVMSHIIREREELENQFNEISKVISHIKLEIRQASKQ